MSNWVYSYTTAKGRTENIDELMQFFIDPTMKNVKRDGSTFFHRSFLYEEVERDDKDGITTITFIFQTAWEMTDNLTDIEKLKMNGCANLYEVAKRLKCNVKIEGEIDTREFRQNILIDAYDSKNPSLITEYIEGKRYSCPKCKETDLFFDDTEYINLICSSCQIEMVVEILEDNNK